MHDYMLEQLIDKIVIVDFDGTLTTYRSTEDKAHTNSENYIGMHIDGYDTVWKYTRPLKTMQNLLSKLDRDRLYVLSQTDTSFEEKNKNRFIANNYPFIKQDNIIYVGRTNYKKTVVEYMFKHGYFGTFDKKSIVIIEDSIEVISQLEDAGYRCYHISSFIE